ncbi:MAG: MmcQ/YjbR family DNA-binding protein [Bacteroidales bacterium]
MNIEDIRAYCLLLKHTTESFPFDETTLVFKVEGKIFALLSLELPHSINLKCDPQEALELREHFTSVTPGYHMNKKHWNTVQINGSIKPNILKEWITQSYELTIALLPKYKQKELLNS